MRIALLALAAIALGSCADDDHEFTAYSGAQQKCPYAPGAFVSTVAGMQVFQSLPSRPYTVIGRLKVVRRRGPIVQEGVVKEARRYGADALFIVDSKTFSNGAISTSNVVGNLYGSGFSASGAGVSVPLRFRVGDVWLIKFFLMDDWKSDYIALLDRPMASEVKLAEAIALKKQNAPAVLYRYRPFTKYARSELLESYFWLAAPDEFNDPFDSAFLISEEILLRRLVKANTKLFLERPETIGLFTPDELKQVMASSEPVDAACEIVQAKQGEGRISWDTAFRVVFDALRSTTSADRAARDPRLRNTIRICCFCENYTSVLIVEPLRRQTRGHLYRVQHRSPV